MANVTGKKRGKKTRRPVVNMTKENTEAVMAQIVQLAAAMERAEIDYKNELAAHNAGFTKSGVAFGNSAKAIIADVRRRCTSIEAIYLGVESDEVDEEDED